MSDPIPVDERLERASKALYDATGKQHGGYEDGRRKGIRTWRSFEWEELAEIDKGGIRRHAQAVLEAAVGVSSDRERERDAQIERLASAFNERVEALTEALREARNNAMAAHREIVCHSLNPDVPFVTDRLGEILKAARAVLPPVATEPECACGHPRDVHAGPGDGCSAKKCKCDGYVAPVAVSDERKDG